MNNLEKIKGKIDVEKTQNIYKVLQSFLGEISDIYYAYFSIFILSNPNFKSNLQDILNIFGINNIFKICQVDFYEGENNNAMFNVYYRVYAKNKLKQAIKMEFENLEITLENSIYPMNEAEKIIFEDKGSLADLHIFIKLNKENSENILNKVRKDFGI